MAGQSARVWGLAGLLVLAGCSGGDSTGPGPGGGGGFTLTVNPSQPSVVQGNAVAVTIAITRSGGFDGAVTLSVQGAPAGLTTALSESATTGNAVTLTLTAGSALAAADYDLMVRGTASGLQDRTQALRLTVTSSGGGGGGGGGGGNASVSFVGCAAPQRAIWFAYQDGNGPWTQVTGAGDVYNFAITQNRGGHAWATQNGNQTMVSVVLWTRSELTSTPIVYCGPIPTKSATGSVTGLVANDRVNIWLANGAASATFALPNFTILAIAEGPADLFAWRNNSLGGSPDRGLVRRDVNVPANGSVGVLDFNGAESFTPATANLTVSGMAQGEMVTQSMNYYSGAACQFAGFYQDLVTATPTLTMRGVPNALRRPNDLHQVGVTALSATGARVTQEWFGALGARTVTLPPNLPAPTVTSLGGPYARLQAAYQLPADYLTTVFLYSAATRSAGITASVGWLGGTNATIAMPDFTGVAGWNSAWVPASGAAGTWFTQATGTNIASANVCVDGRRVISAQRTGTY